MRTTGKQALPCGLTQALTLHQQAMPDALLFEVTPAISARRLNLDDAPLLQRFIEANPEYWWRVGDAPPGAGEALEELSSRPPPELSWREHHDIGFWQQAGADAPAELLGFAIVDSDLVLPGCWHIALFIIATALHGHGQAQACYSALEQWARAGGAQWLRLGVVQGNSAAERFWARQGFVPLRLRGGVAAGQRINTVAVMLKPLVPEAGVAAYLAQVPRDRPE